MGQLIYRLEIRTVVSVGVKINWEVVLELSGDRIVVYLSEWWLQEYLHIYPNSLNCISNINNKIFVCKF